MKILRLVFFFFKSCCFKSCFWFFLVNLIEVVFLSFLIWVFSLSDVFFSVVKLVRFLSDKLGINSFVFLVIERIDLFLVEVNLWFFLVLMVCSFCLSCELCCFSLISFFLRLLFFCVKCLIFVFFERRVLSVFWRNIVWFCFFFKVLINFLYLVFIWERRDL